MLDRPPLQGDAHVWCFRVDVEEATCAPFSALLSVEERAAAARFRFAADRVRSIVSHANLRRLLAGYVGCDPAELRFAVNGFGKPAIAAPAAAKTLGFNLSHSGSLAVIAVAAGREIGVDVEEARPDMNNDELASLYFSASERDWLGTLNELERTAGFYRLWTVKEALLKAHGTGLSVPLDQVEIAFPGDEVVVHFPGAAPETGGGEWWAKELQLADGYKAAIAAAGGALRVQSFRDLPADFLLRH